MIAPSGAPDTVADAGAEPARTSDTSAPRYPGMPRWVKVSGIVVLVLVLLVVLVMVAGRGQHGPGRHMPSGAPGAPGAPGGHTPPVAQAVLQA